jgi:hypothetical protein
MGVWFQFCQFFSWLTLYDPNLPFLSLILLSWLTNKLIERATWDRGVATVSLSFVLGLNTFLVTSGTRLNFIERFNFLGSELVRVDEFPHVKLHGILRSGHRKNSGIYRNIVSAICFISGWVPGGCSHWNFNSGLAMWLAAWWLTNKHSY